MADTETHDSSPVPAGGKKKDKRTWIIIGLSVVGVVLAYVTYRAVARGGGGQTSSGVTSLPASTMVPSGGGGGGGGSSSTSTGSTQAMSMAQQQLAATQAQNSSLITDLISAISSKSSVSSPPVTSSTAPSSTIQTGSGSAGDGWAPSGQLFQPASQSPSPQPVQSTVHLTTPSGYRPITKGIDAANAWARSGYSVLYRNNTTGTFGKFVPGSGKTPANATLFVQKGG